jgi:hypothetical protein
MAAKSVAHLNRSDKEQFVQIPMDKKSGQRLNRSDPGPLTKMISATRFVPHRSHLALERFLVTMVATKRDVRPSLLGKAQFVLILMVVAPDAHPNLLDKGPCANLTKGFQSAFSTLFMTVE